MITTEFRFLATMHWAGILTGSHTSREFRGDLGWDSSVGVGGDWSRSIGGGFSFVDKHGINGGIVIVLNWRFRAGLLRSRFCWRGCRYTIPLSELVEIGRIGRHITWSKWWK
jgi:hypothetical protein